MSHKKKASPVGLAPKDESKQFEVTEIVDSPTGLMILDKATGESRPATEEEIQELAEGERELHTTQPFTFELLDKIETEMGKIMDNLKAGLLLQIEASNIVKSESDALRMKAQKDLVNREMANARDGLNHMAGEVFNIVSKRLYGDKACTMVGDETLMPELQ